MRRGQRASSSSESEDNQRPRSKDSADQWSPRGCSSDDDSLSDSDAEAERVMKRSQRFSSSFSFGDDHQPQSRNEDREEELSPKKSNGVPVTELVEAELAAECVRLEKRDTFCDTNQPSRSSLFRPQELWLAVTRCLSLRWPPCLSINRQSNRKVAYQVDLDQSEDRSSVSSETTNESSSSTSTLDDRDVMLVKHEEGEARSRRVKSGPPHFRGISRTSPRLPRARQATDSVLASVILEKETFLRIELVDSGDDREDLRYRAEWKLSEKTKELAEGVWLSRSQKSMD